MTSHLDEQTERIMQLGILQDNAAALQIYPRANWSVKAHRDFNVPLADLRLEEIKNLIRTIPAVAVELLSVHFSSRLHPESNSHMRVQVDESFEEHLQVCRLFEQKVLKVLEKAFRQIALDIEELQLNDESSHGLECDL